MKNQVFLAGLLWMSIVDVARPAAPGELPPGQPGPDKLPLYDSAAVYLLPKDRWLTFDIPPHQKILRVLTSASLSRNQPVSVSDEWAYGLRYELLTRQGKLVVTKPYECRARLTRFVDAPGAAPYTAGFFRNEPIVPLDSRTILVNLRALDERPALLRMKLESADPKVLDVGVRVYAQEQQPEHKLRIRWQRLTAARMEQFARASVYRPELLTDEEKMNLVRTTWSPVGPVGLEGREFTRRLLYTLKEVAGKPVEAPPLPEGLLLRSRLHGIVPLPEAGGQVKLVFLPIAAPGAGGPAEDVQILWYGRLLFQRSSLRVPWNDRGFSVDRQFAGGQLEVRSPRDVVLRAFLMTGTESVEITPSPSYLKTYRAEPSRPVEFPFLHVKSKTVPCRIRLWTMSDHARPDSPPATTRIRYELLDAGKNLLSSAQIVASQPGSLYTRLEDPLSSVRVSDPTSWFIDVPENVSFLRVVSELAPVLVATENRPGDMRKQTSVPEDFFRFYADRKVHRAWFPLAASDQEGLLLAGRIQLLIVQERPPVDDPDKAAGLFEWVAQYPLGRWRGRKILVPKPAESPDRPEAVPSTFVPVPRNREVRLAFRAGDGRRHVSPDLVYEGLGQSWTRLSLFVDGALLAASHVSGPDGEVVLPPVPVGAHRVRLDCSAPLRAFINYADPGKGPAMTSRLAVRLTGKPLVYDVEKRGPEAQAIMLRHFTQPKQSERATFTVDIGLPAGRATGHVNDWTFEGHAFDVRPAGGHSLPVLASRGGRSDEGQPFFVNLGNDIPAGHYRIRVTPHGHATGYLEVSQVHPGRPEKRKIFFESEVGEPEGRR
ncbi:MAG: hypothetical protein HY815_02015 [Candidatus Riflebacteria bacterium]|nr:hypothetical protein [Candidatus Riflebacteria bacterium]